MSVLLNKGLINPDYLGWSNWEPLTLKWCKYIRTQWSWLTIISFTLTIQIFFAFFSHFYGAKDDWPHFNSRGSSQVSFLICGNNVQPSVAMCKFCDPITHQQHENATASAVCNYLNHLEDMNLDESCGITSSTFILFSSFSDLQQITFQISSPNRKCIPAWSPLPTKAPSTVSKSAAWAPAAIPRKFPGKWGRINENTSVV